jgi:hypothetical protein
VLSSFFLVTESIKVSHMLDVRKVRKKESVLLWLGKGQGIHNLHTEGIFGRPSLNSHGISAYVKIDKSQHAGPLRKAIRLNEFLCGVGGRERSSLNFTERSGQSSCRRTRLCSKLCAHFCRDWSASYLVIWEVNAWSSCSVARRYIILAGLFGFRSK